MKENAILIRNLDILKVYVDFSDLDNIKSVLNCDRLSTIHTAKTQELSEKLGFHLMGYVDREGDDINNEVACEVSGYDYIGSFMLLFKTDDSYHELSLSEDELEKLYSYLTIGEIDNAKTSVDLDNKKPEVDLDAPEELIEEDYDDEILLVPYVLIFDVKCKWPKRSDKSFLDGSFAYPMVLEGDVEPNIFLFEDRIEVEGYDLLHEAIDLILHLGKDIHVNVGLDKEEKVEFEYLNEPDNPESYRVGSITIRLEKHMFELSSIANGKLVIDEEIYINSDTPSNELRKIINNPEGSNKDSQCCIFETTDYFYRPWLVEYTGNFLILMLEIGDADYEDAYYLPIYRNKELLFLNSDISDTVEDTAVLIKYRYNLED